MKFRMVHYRLYSSKLRFNLQARNKIRTQTLLDEETHSVWDSEWSHVFIFSIPNEISIEAIATFSVNKDYITYLMTNYNIQ